MKFEQGGLQAKYFSAKIVTGLQPMGSGEARFAFTIQWGLGALGAFLPPPSASE